MFGMQSNPCASHGIGDARGTYWVHTADQASGH